MCVEVGVIWTPIVSGTISRLLNTNAICSSCTNVCIIHETSNMSIFLYATMAIQQGKKSFSYFNGMQKLKLQKFW